MKLQRIMTFIKDFTKNCLPLIRYHLKPHSPTLISPQMLTHHLPILFASQLERQHGQCNHQTRQMVMGPGPVENPSNPASQPECLLSASAESGRPTRHRVGQMQWSRASSWGLWEVNFKIRSGMSMSHGITVILFTRVTWCRVLGQVCRRWLMSPGYWYVKGSLVFREWC